MEKIRTLITSTKLLDRKISTREVLFILAILFCLSPWMSPPLALILGILFAQGIGHPYLRLNHRAIQILLQVSVVGLGFGMNVFEAIQSGKQGVLFTVVSIFGTLLLGSLLGKIFHIEKKTSLLISVGTAICGGSAIAAISPVIQAEERQLSVALGTVFVLNSIALFLFPLIGQWLHLDATQFGLWCAIAIHDTSSVVGAASKFGPHALEVATTVKLVRALWIIPVAIGTAFLYQNKSKKIKIPYFIGLFVLAMVGNTFVPQIHRMAPVVVALSKSGLTLTLFLIGAGLSRAVLKSVGYRPMLQGILLWITISTSALWAVMTLIHP
ncbi:MAG: YeiH family protein [Chitinophagaceae bacterium]